ncbi:putative F-box/FBD/LRR-repeat protein [Cocos nucifera]|uniref:Putative F-box/FBD/LRR-repeat protein n=1 Tax=Cocos nucifera TaxID=13894 RepID=A0A8K0NCV0_COCNU|nr:putative F-box/FBD/LRR-repeat protein [Cocos nucifera]
MASNGKKRTIVSDSEPHRSGGIAAADGPDRFSLLLDYHLVSILSVLPIEDSVRTSVLSTGWRHLWTLPPLRLLDDSTLRRPHQDKEGRLALEGWRVRAIDRVLSAHAGPIWSCRLSCLYFHLPLLDGWIQTLSRKGVQDLALLIPMDKRFYLAPPSLITCRSLQSLELCYFRFPKPTHPRPDLVNLRALKLKRNLVTDAAVHEILSSCPALQSLALHSSPLPGPLQHDTG